MSYRNRQQQKTAQIMWDSLVGAYRVQFTFDAAIVEMIKMHVPSHERSLDVKNAGGKKLYSWLIQENHFDWIELMFKGLSYKVTTLKKEEAEEKAKNFQQSFGLTPIDTNAEMTKFIRLLSEAGITYDKENKDFDIFKKAHRRAALFYHPDRNPLGATKMSDLNSAFQAIKETLFKEIVA